METMAESKLIHYTDTIHYELEQTSKLMRKLTNQLFVKLDIIMTMDEYSALDTISVNAGICQRDLAKLILKDRANTGRILSSLEGKGFITRFIDTKNNRLVKKMGITEAGYNELKSATEKLNAYIDKITVKKISPKEVEKVQQTLRQFRIDLEQAVKMNI